MDNSCVAHDYYLGLGGNIGDVESHMREALVFLQQKDCVLLRLSSVYRTPPWGGVTQDEFLNSCALVRSRYMPEDFLALVQEAEQRLKRERLVKWGPRTLDIDILAISGGEFYNSANLKIPHPFVRERAFVLVPLNEIAPDLSLYNRSVSEWARKVDSEYIIKIAPSTEWEKLMNRLT